MTRLDRALGILLLLGDGRPITAPGLAARFEVSVRTIYREVDLLSALGVPVYADRGATGGYRLHEGYFLPPVAFTRDEAASLLLALTLLLGQYTYLQMPKILDNQNMCLILHGCSF